MNSAPTDSKWRRRAQQVLERYFRDRSWPRLILSLILILTGVGGFGVSFALLHLGIKQMWLRYPISVLAGYGLFLLLLRLWVGWEKSRFRPRSGEIESAISNAAPDEDPQWERPATSRWFDWLDLPGDVDPEGCTGLLLFGVVIGLVSLLVFAIISASSLIAEVFLDAFIVAVLYRRLRIAAREHWLGTAVRKTWVSALLTAALLSFGGWCLEALAPGAHSIGPALHRLLDDPIENPPKP